MLPMQHGLTRNRVLLALTQLVEATVNVRLVKRASFKTQNTNNCAIFVSKAFIRMRLESQYAKTASQASTVTAWAEVLVLHVPLAIGTT